MYLFPSPLLLSHTHPFPLPPPILPFSHIHPSSLTPSHTSQTNGEGMEWQYLVNEYICLLTKCANHLGLLLPDKTPSKRQKQKVVYDHRLLALQYPDLLIQGYPASFQGFPPPSHKSLGMRLASPLLILCEAGHGAALLLVTCSAGQSGLSGSVLQTSDIHRDVKAGLVADPLRPPVLRKNEGTCLRLV